MFEPRSDGVVTLADGRTMGVAEWGVPEGQPVVFLHGTPNSRLWCPHVKRPRQSAVGSSPWTGPG
jgi:pimeloyl-ACP methyl ester carboxylesterase